MFYLLFQITISRFMKGIVFTNKAGLKRRLLFLPNLNPYVQPVLYSLFGFFSFFVLITVLKYFSSVFNTEEFEIDNLDLYLSILGSILFLSHKILTNYSSGR
jgi:hypothetical protein